MISMFSEKGLIKAYSLSITAFLAIMIGCFFGCTLKREPVPKGMIPKINTFNVAEEKFGQKVYKDLSKKYKLYENLGPMERITSVFDRLIQVAGVDYLPWYLHFFDAPDIIDVRAVHGNRFFSGQVFSMPWRTRTKWPVLWLAKLPMCWPVTPNR